MVRQEAAYFSPTANVRVLITGMGKDNAARRFRENLENSHPGLVLTCGFAGALNPALHLNQVVFDAEPGSIASSSLLKCGAIPGRFHCSSRVLSTASEKQAAFEFTGADAVEMESKVIREICAKSGIPSATVRVISDIAGEDLPLDFNALMTPSCQINFLRLGLALVKSPRKIPSLLKFQKQTVGAARALAGALEKICEDLRGKIGNL